MGNKLKRIKIGKFSLTSCLGRGSQILKAFTKHNFFKAFV